MKKALELKVSGIFWGLLSLGLVIIRLCRVWGLRLLHFKALVGCIINNTGLHGAHYTILIITNPPPKKK